MKDKAVILIGCGRIGFLLEDDPLRNKPCTHAGGAAAAGIKITHAVDIDTSRLDLFCTRYEIPPDNCCTDYKELFKKVSPDIVIVATWTASHTDIGIAALKAGADIVVLEKPVAPSLSEARRLLDTARQTGGTLIINHERRYDPRYQKVLTLLEKEKIGKLKTIHASILTGPYRGPSDISEGGGPLLHDGTHLVDIISFFGGKITEVSGDFQRDNRSSGYEDRATAWLKTEQGVDVFLEAGGSRKYFHFELTLSGTEGKIIIGNGYQSLYLTDASRYYRGFQDLREVDFPTIPKGNCFTTLYREVKTLMKDRNRAVSSSGEKGYDALEAIHGIYLSSSKQGIKIKLPLKGKRINLEKIFDIEE